MIFKRDAGAGSGRFPRWGQKREVVRRRNSHRWRSLERLESRCLLAADLSGQVFDDLNGNQQWEPAAPTLEPALGCWTVFLDANQNGSLDDGEPQQLTASDGSYHFSVNAPGEYAVNLVPEPGYDRSTPIRFGLDTTLVAGTIQDHVFDPVRSILYSTAGNQVLRTNPQNSQELLLSLGVGTSLTALDVTPDGKFLLVGEGTTAEGKGRLYKIDLTNNSVTAIEYTLQVDEGGVFDIAAVSNDRVLFTTGSTTNGLVPLRQIELSTETVTTRTESFGAAAGEIPSNSRLERNDSRSALLLVHAHDSGGRVDWYSTTDNTFVRSTQLNQTLDNAHITISRDGKLAAIESPDLGLRVYNDQFELVTTLTHFRGGISFDSVRNILYSGATDSDELVAISTTSWDELYRVAVGEDLPVSGTYFEMQMSPRAKYLSFTTPSGVRFVPLARAVPQIVNVVEGQAVSQLNFGNRANGDNRRPLVFGDNYSLLEDGSLSISASGVLSNDVDPDNSPMSAQLVTNVQHGALTLQPNGSFSYAPDSNYFGTDSFAYRAFDNQYLSCRSATVNINVLPVNDPPTQINISGMTIDENASGGTIGQVVVVDADPADQFTFTVSDGRFEVSNGFFRLRDGISLNHELAQTIELTITATDQGSPPLSMSTTITIQVTDVNEFDPTIETTEIEVTEGGTTVGTIETRDDDSTQTVEITIVGGNDDGIFSMDPSTGILSINDGFALDYEATQSYTLTLSVTDSATPPRTSTTDVTITVADENEYDPVVTPETFDVAENAPSGTVVGTVTATDADTGQTLTYSIVGGNDSAIFTIDANTGEIAVLDSTFLDREQVEQFILTVQATDSLAPARSGTADITISVTNVNEFDPMVQDQSLELFENSPDGTIVTTVGASDLDAVTELTYEITDGNAAGAFTIDSQTGEITVASESALDLEAVLQFVLTVNITDNTSPVRSSVSQITIDLKDVNEFDPEMSDYSFRAPADASAGYLVGTMQATDQDRTHGLAYWIQSGNDEGGFAIEAFSGRIIVAQNGILNDLAGSDIVLGIHVSDSGEPARTTEAQVTISVAPGNAHAPTLADATFSIPENSTQGTILGTVSASDLDDGTSFSYQLSNPSTSPFAINSTTGEISVLDATALDFETTQQFELTVTVSDGGLPERTDEAVITVHLTDVNEHQPSFDNNLTFSVDENSEAGTLVGAVTATDGDSHQTVTYSISNAAFAIGAASGVITVANGSALDYESADQIAVTVTATDNGNPSKSGSMTVTIEVNNLNEFAPSVADRTFSIVENSMAGAFVGTVTATDLDSPQDSFSFEIVGGDSENTFSINAATGEITVSNSALIDFESVPQYVLLVSVNDHGVPPLSRSGTMTINVQGVNEPPVNVTLDVASVMEHWPGASVGLVTVQDPDSGDTHTFSVDDSRFTVDASRILKLNPGVEVDYDASNEIPVQITATDAGGFTTTQQIIIQVLVNAKPWQNASNPLDVNGDGMVTPGDVLIVINEINTPAASDSFGTLPSERPDTPNTPFFDVNGDGSVSPIDVLIIINDLNGANSNNQAEGEAGLWASRSSFDSVPILTAQRPSQSPAPLVDEPILWVSPLRNRAFRSQRGDDLDDLEATLDDLANDISSAWELSNHT